MKITRILARSAAVITAVAGMGLAAAGPAGASVPPGGSQTGVWRAFGNTNPTTVVAGRWRCASTRQIGVNVGAQICTVVDLTNFTSRAALIVRDNKPVEYNAAGTMQLFAIDPPPRSLGTWDCPLSGVAPGTWSVCFGNVISVGVLPTDATGEAGNGVSLGTSPPN